MSTTGTETADSLPVNESACDDETVCELDFMSSVASPMRSLQCQPSSEQEATASPIQYQLDGETYYLIENVIAFHPRKGYLVDWKGYGKESRSWQRARDMPRRNKEIVALMKQVREQWKAEQLSTRV